MGIWQRMGDQLRGITVEMGRATPVEDSPEAVLQEIVANVPAVASPSPQMIDMAKVWTDKLMQWRKMRSLASMYSPGLDVDVDGTMGRGRIHRLGNIGPRERMLAVAERRAEGRMLYQRNAMAQQAINLWVLFTIANGLNYKFRPKTRAKQFTKKWNQWAFSNEAHIMRHLTLQEIDQQTVRTVKAEGEALVRWFRPLDNRAVPLAMNVYQTDHISTLMHLQSQVPNGYVADGIDRNRYGAPIGCWFHPRHPNDGWSEPEYVAWDDPKIGRQLELLFLGEAANMTRGVNNPGAMALDLALDAADVRGLRVDRMRLESSESRYVTTGAIPATPRMMSPIAPPVAPEGADGPAYDEATGQLLQPASVPEFDGSMPSWMEMFQFVNDVMSNPGSTPVLLPGMDIHTREMGQSSDFAPMWKILERGIAQCYGVPGPWLSQDAADANMSSMNNIVMPFRNDVESLQEIVINRVANITARNFINAGNSMGIRNGGWAENADEMEYTVFGNKMASTQADKDIRIIVTMLANRLISYEEAVQMLGRDPEELKAAIKANRKWLASEGAMPAEGSAALPFSISPQIQAQMDQAAADEQAAEDAAQKPNPGSAGGGRGNQVDD